MYHSVSSADIKPIFIVGHPKSLKLRLNMVSPQSFDRQMGFLAHHGYHVISLDEYIKGKKERKQFSFKTVVITFDDGYEDNYTNAFPILQKYHFPATIFLISEAPETSPDVLNWQQIIDMSKNGISFGSHTRHHAYLPGLTEVQMKDELVGSKKTIEEHLGKTIDYFAYPSGGFNDEAKAMVAQAGYKAALATNRGFDRKNIDLYELNRIHINNWDNDFTLFGKLSGFYNSFREARQSH